MDDFPFGLYSEDGGVAVAPRRDALTGKALPKSGYVTRRVKGTAIFYRLSAQSARSIDAAKKAELDEAAREAVQRHILDEATTKKKTAKRSEKPEPESDSDVNERSGGKGGA